MRSLLRLAACSAAAVLVAACSTERGLEAMSVLHDIAISSEAGPDQDGVVRRTVRYSVDGRRRRGDIYHGAKANAGMVLVPGAARAGKDDRRLVAFAYALARAKFTVLVPDIVNVRALKVGPEDTRDVGDAIRYLSDRTRRPAQGRVGVTAISYGTGPAILAAMEEGTRERVDFVVAIGGYYDLGAAITYFTTGYFKEPAEAEWHYRRPNAYGKWVFVRGNADRLEDPADRSTVAAMAERKLFDLSAPIDDLVPRLHSEGRSVHALMSNRDPDKVAGLIAALPKPVRSDIAALDLERRDLSKLDARLFLIHGRDDPIIPHSESMALAAAVGTDRANLYLVDYMGHTDAGAGGFQDSLTIWRAIYAILERRDAMPPVAVPDRRSASSN